MGGRGSLVPLRYFEGKKSERPVDALAVKNIPYPLTDNLKSIDASASKNHPLYG